MAPRRSSVKNKHAFSYGVCPFCNKEILEGEPTNIEHVFPNNQINRAYGTMFNGKRAMTLNIEKSISVLVHKKCNEEDAGLEKKISDIINYLLDPNVSNKQLSYGQIKNIFKFGEKVAKFLPYLPDLKGQFTPPKNFDRVSIFRNVLPLGMIVRQQGSVMISFPGIIFEYVSMGGWDPNWIAAINEDSITIRKCERGYDSWALHAHKIVEKNQFIRCTRFHEYKPFLHFGGMDREVGVLLSRQDIACLKAVPYLEQESICNQLNLRKLVQSGDITPNILNATDWQKSAKDAGLPQEFIKGALNYLYGMGIGKKINWLSKNRKFKVPDDVIDMVIYEDGYLKIFHKVEWVNQIGLVKSKYKFINTATLEQGYEISKDVLLAADGMETIDDLSKCKVNGSVVLTWNNLQTLKGSPYAVLKNFYCDRNELTTLLGAPQEVGGNFWCNGNKLTTLLGAPQKVGGSFRCYDNELTTLLGAPQLIRGDFDCSDNKLTTLLGAPQKVGGNFDCNRNELTTLGGAPQEVGGNFWCYGNKLTTLLGAPQEVGGNFWCDGNELTTLLGAPQKVGGNFYCERNKLTTLIGAPQKVGGNFYCSRNELTTLDGAPQEVGGDFWCVGNELTTLLGAPQKVGGNFWCDGNELTTLLGAPQKVGGNFIFDAEHLQSLDGLPMAQKYFVDDLHKSFDTADELRAWFAEYKKQRDGKKSIVTGLRAGAKRVAAAGAVQETKRNTKPDNQKKK